MMKRPAEVRVPGVTSSGLSDGLATTQLPATRASTIAEEPNDARFDARRATGVLGGLLLKVRLFFCVTLQVNEVQKLRGSSRVAEGAMMVLQGDLIDSAIPSP
jgi:hypothetical protein